MRILVIEDEARIQAFVRRGLEAEGYGVVTADDGRDGLSLARSGDTVSGVCVARRTATSRRQDPFDRAVPDKEGLRRCEPPESETVR